VTDALSESTAAAESASGCDRSGAAVSGAGWSEADEGGMMGVRDVVALDGTERTAGRRAPTVGGTHSGGGGSSDSTGRDSPAAMPVPMLNPTAEPSWTVGVSVD